MISKTGEAETITSHYLFALGIYRALYILNWIYRYYMEGFFDFIAVVAGCVQTVLYCDFFYLYVTKGKRQFSETFSCSKNWLIYTLLISWLKPRNLYHLLAFLPGVALLFIENSNFLLWIIIVILGILGVVSGDTT